MKRQQFIKEIVNTLYKFYYYIITQSHHYIIKLLHNYHIKWLYYLLSTLNSTDILLYPKINIISHQSLMLIKLTVLQLVVNLPFQDCDVFFLLNMKNRQDSLPEGLVCENTDEYVLMSQVTDYHMMDMNFMVEMENPEDQAVVDLHVFAISSSSSKVKLLGSSEIDLKNLIGLSHQNQQILTLTQQLKGIQNQKGNVTFELNTVQKKSCVSLENSKLSQSFEKQQTTSSDSYEFNLKQLNVTLDLQSITQVPDNLNDATESYETLLSSQQIILEQIDLQDSDDQAKTITQKDSKVVQNSQSETLILIQNGKTHCKQSRQFSEHKSDYFLEEKLKIVNYLYKLQESDFSMLRIQERLSNYLE